MQTHLSESFRIIKRITLPYLYNRLQRCLTKFQEYKERRSAPHMLPARDCTSVGVMD